MLWDQQTCYTGAYVSPQTGAKITQYGNTSITPGCNQALPIADEEVYPFLNLCVAGSFYSTITTCNATHAVLSGYFGTCVCGDSLTL